MLMGSCSVTAIPKRLLEALRPVTVVVGHYGAGKTNFTVNLALGLRAAGREVTVIDLDIVNPYFRASEQRSALEAAGVRLVAPVYAEAGSSLDVPSLTGRIDPAISDASENGVVLIDAGGDDVGATALGRYFRLIDERGYAMLYVANRFRNLVADPQDALENLREIEVASHLHATAIVNNSHLKEDTDVEAVRLGVEYSAELAALAELPVICTTVPKAVDAVDVEDAFSVEACVRTPWEQ